MTTVTWVLYVDIQDRCFVSLPKVFEPFRGFADGGIFFFYMAGRPSVIVNVAVRCCRPF